MRNRNLRFGWLAVIASVLTPSMGCKVRRAKSEVKDETNFTVSLDQPSRRVCLKATKTPNFDYSKEQTDLIFDIIFSEPNRTVWEIAGLSPDTQSALAKIDGDRYKMWETLETSIGRNASSFGIVHATISFSASNMDEIDRVKKFLDWQVAFSYICLNLPLNENSVIVAKHLSGPEYRLVLTEEQNIIGQHWNGDEFSLSLVASKPTAPNFVAVNARSFGCDETYCGEVSEPRSTDQGYTFYDRNSSKLYDLDPGPYVDKVFGTRSAPCCIGATSEANGSLRLCKAPKCQGFIPIVRDSSCVPHAEYFACQTLLSQIIAEGRTDLMEFAMVRKCREQLMLPECRY